LEKIFDPIRKIWVADLPEERVRQKLLWEMTEILQYPRELLSIEKELQSLVFFQDKKFPAEQRRVDILCFAKDLHPKHSLYPLLLIECKAIKLTEKVIEQVLGYNHYIQACFVCIVSPEEIFTYWHDERTKRFERVSFLPSYPELFSSAKKVFL
jgi:hypothetical protein